MARSKNRAQWTDLPPAVHREIQRIAGGQVVAAVNCPGGYSPGFASRLTLADGRQVFAKAINGTEWPGQLETYRAEARTAAVLPSSVPAPALQGTTEADDWLALVFQDIAGQEPDQPWRPDDLIRTLGAIKPHKAPGHLSTDHPRLGGWQSISNDRRAIDQLKAFDPWAYENLSPLADLETHGLEMAKGEHLVHCDLYPHNILLTEESVYVVDWPHARQGAPYLDVLTVLSTAAWHGIDPEPFVATHPLTAGVDVRAIHGVLAAQAGFCVTGTLGPVERGTEPIRDYKLGLCRAVLAWLKRRTTRQTQCQN
jgi:aminoglycoside phosphotransferase (APT) family kinase protein